ncbi:MAG: MYXO-CTERM sorting domain-containing protein, partial [Polyangiales bacterium]
QPTEGTYDWALFDTIIDNARSRGLTVLAVLAYTPKWASAGDVDGKRNDNDVPRAGAYEAFVTAAVTRYASKVTYWEIWNEPNLGEFFEGTPDQYVELILKPGAAAVHAACGACKVLAPGLATVGGKYDVWMDAALSKAKDRIDIVSGHVYADFAKSPTDVSFFSKLDKHRVLTLGDATLYEDPLSLRESMIKNGAAGKPFWLTETGKGAAFGNVPEMDLQSNYVRHVLEAMLTRSWWQATVFYEAFDEPGQPYTWGFSLHDGKPPTNYSLKPVCDVLAKAVDRQPLFGGKGADCDDGLDNEGDGLIDYPKDPECSAASTFSEGPPPGPDAGDDAGADADDDAAVADDDAASSDDAEPAATAADAGSGGCGCAVRPGATGVSPFAALAAALGVVRARRRRRARTRAR